MPQYIWDPQRKQYVFDAAMRVRSPFGDGRFDPPEAPYRPAAPFQGGRTLTAPATGPTMGAGMPYAQYTLPQPDSADGQLARYLEFTPSGAELPPPGTEMHDAQGRPVDYQSLLELLNRINAGRRLVPSRFY